MNPRWFGRIVFHRIVAPPENSEARPRIRVICRESQIGGIVGSSVRPFPDGFIEGSAAQQGMAIVRIELENRIPFANGEFVLSTALGVGGFAGEADDLIAVGATAED